MATMRSSASSNGPGMGARPSAASPRSGRGMRLSVAAIFTARRVLLKLFMKQRDLRGGDSYRTVLGFRPSSRATTARGICGASVGRGYRGSLARLLSGGCAPSSRLPLGRLRRHGLQSDVVDHAAHSTPKK